MGCCDCVGGSNQQTTVQATVLLGISTKGWSDLETEISPWSPIKYRHTALCPHIWDLQKGIIVCFVDKYICLCMFRLYSDLCEGAEVKKSCPPSSATLTIFVTLPFWRLHHSTLHKNPVKRIYHFSSQPTVCHVADTEPVGFEPRSSHPSWNFHNHTTLIHPKLKGSNAFLTLETRFWLHQNTGIQQR